MLGDLKSEMKRTYHDSDCDTMVMRMVAEMTRDFGVLTLDLVDLAFQHWN